MHSTRVKTAAHPFLGADLTDRYAKSCKPIDVCGLRPSPGNALSADFWTWEWDLPGKQVQVGSLLPELSEGVSAMLDGPQGLAERPATMRLCERKVGAAGKTPCKRFPVPNGRPFAGFVMSGLDLFDALDQAGVRLASSTDPTGIVGEVYPGDLWPLLVRRGLSTGAALPKKTRKQGWLIRKALLEAVGVRFGPSLIEGNHDQLDACVGAVVAAGRMGAVPELETPTEGNPIYRDAKGVLREGEMYRINVVGDGLRDAVQAALRPFAADLIKAVRHKSPRGGKALCLSDPKIGPLALIRQWIVSATNSIKECQSARPCDRAAALLSWLVDAAGAERGGPVLFGYGAAWRLILPEHPFPDNRGAHAFNEIIDLAKATPLQTWENFAPVRLDAFLVNERTRMPGGGHWKEAEYDQEDWMRVFGNAILVKSQEVKSVMTEQK